MSATKRSTMLAALLIALLAVPAYAQTGTIIGRVTEAGSGTEDPISGAQVEVRLDGRTVATGLTNADGVYRITNLAAGTYTVVATSLSHVPSSPQTAQVSAGGTATVDMSLRPSAIELAGVTVTTGRVPEKLNEAPARVDVVTERTIDARPVTTPADHLQNYAGIDIVRQGVQSTNVVIRGFNNIFSGATHLLTDNRIAGVPSLRVNVMNFIPSTNEDLDRIEVVYGPGSALYGPNTANGVIHMITKSPLDEQGTSVAVSGGERSVLNGTFRTSHLLSPAVGFKLSGQYFRAEEWPYTDPVEVAEEQKFASSPFWKQDLINATGISPAEADLRISRINDRDFDFDRWSGEARLDWKATNELTTILSVGRSNASQIELTGLGAAQASDWSYTYVQARANWRRAFAQVYLNASDAGDTYLLRNGVPIVDKSKLWVGQLQNQTGFSSGRQTFTYGVDFIKTLPDTEGSINGIYEDDDETTEIGAYIQSETAITRKLDLVLAGRVDDHSALPDPIFSPRAALVIKPSQTQTFRATYNRAFSTPSSLNRYLDLPTAAPDPTLAQLGFSARVQGTGADGFTFRQAGGGYMMRSPFTPAGMGGSAQLLPANAALFWSAAVQVVAQQAAARGTPIDPMLVGYLTSLSPSATDISTNYLNPNNLATGSLSELDLPPIEAIREETSTTFEAGYRGVFSDRLVLAADVWYSKRKNLVTPLITMTPLLTLNPQQTGAFLVTRLMTDLGMPAQQAQAIAGQLTPGLAQIPLGVISSADVNANGAQILATYVNVDREIDLWGVDLSAQANLGTAWAARTTVSFVNDDVFEYVIGNDTTDVTLNAPKFKATAALGYDRPNQPGLGGEIRVRHTDSFPVASGVYQGTRCLLPPGSMPGPDIEECVDSYTLFDLLINYDLPFQPGLSIDLNVQNVLDEEYRSFPGVPAVGRMALLRLRYVFGN